MTTDLLWPRYATPADLTDIESIPLTERGLPESTYELLARAARLWPDRTALTVLPDATRWTEPSRRTFSELLSDVHKTANALHDLGIQRHNAVAIISPNCDELITATLAAQLAGIAAPVNGALSDDHIAELVQRAGSRVLIAAAPELDPAAWDTVQHLVAAGVVDTVLLLRPTGHRAAFTRPPHAGGASVAYLSELAEKYDSTAFYGQPPAAGDLAALFHTGGTTGKPKPAAHTHANEVTDAWMIAANSLLDDDSVLFAGLPLFHVNALVVTLLAPLLRGQQAVWAGPLGYRDTAIYANFWKIVQQYGIAAMSAVPTVYAVLAQCPVDADISSLRYALVGASALPTAVRKDFESHTGVPLLEGYGLTGGHLRQRAQLPRASAARLGGPTPSLSTRQDRAHRRCGSLARPSPRRGRESRDQWTNRLPRVCHCARGRLVRARRARQTQRRLAGYRRPGADRPRGFRAPHRAGQGSHHPGRPQHRPRDDRGCPAVASRRDGRRCGRQADAHAGEVPVAYVTVTPAASVTEDELRAWAGQHVDERAAVPKLVSIVDALPVTAVGKPFKLGLRANAAQHAIEEALEDVVGVHAVEARVDDGSIIVTVTAGPEADAAAIDATLGRYALAWELKERS